MQYSSIPIPPFLIYPTILYKFFTLAKKIRRIADHLLFLFVFIYFLIFVCSKGHPSSNSGPSKENFMKRVQIQDDEEAKSQGDGERRNKKLREQALCELSHVISRIFIHTVRKGNFVTQD